MPFSIEYSMSDEGRPFSALYIRDFRLFWIAQIISLSGTWMHMIGQGWLVYNLTHSPLFLGIAGAAFSLPILLFTLFGGVIADRYSKRNILIFTQTFSIFPPLLLGVLASTGIVNVWHVIAIAFAAGTINAFDIPVRQSFLVEMVGKGHLLNAIALNSASFHGARIVGPMVGGLIISMIGLPACFFINGLSHIPVIFVLRKMLFRVEGRGGSRGMLNEVREGLQFILNRTDIRWVMLTIVVFSLFGIPYHQFLPVFAEDVFNVGAKGLGYLMSAAGAGALFAAIIIAFAGDMKRKRMYMSLASITFPLALLLFSLSRNYLLSMLLLFLSGWAVVSFLATANSSIQLSVSDKLRGRVMSVYSLGFLGMVPIGNALLGLIADALTTPMALTLAGAVCLLAGVLFSGRQRAGKDRPKAEG